MRFEKLVAGSNDREVVTAIEGRFGPPAVETRWRRRGAKSSRARGKVACSGKCPRRRCGSGRFHRGACSGDSALRSVGDSTPRRIEQRVGRV